MYKFLLKLLGWKVVGKPIGEKSVCVVAPHTSYLDGFYGLLALKSIGINYKILSAEWLFFWPMKYIMKYLLHAIPVGKTTNPLRTAVAELRKPEPIHLVICPEGQLKPTDNWSAGCYVMAHLPDVPVNFWAIDYKNKQVICLDSYQSLTDVPKDTFMNQMYELYRMFLDNGGEPRHPNKFQLPIL